MFSKEFYRRPNSIFFPDDAADLIDSLSVRDVCVDQKT